MEYEAALSQLRNLFSESTTGGGRTAIVTGGLAVGKTHLLHELSDHVSTAGAIYICAIGTRRETTRSGGVIDQLLRGIRARTEVSTSIGDGLPESFSHSNADAAECGYLEEVICAGVLELSIHRPVVIAVDDLQFADRRSLEVLLYLQRRIASAATLLVLTEWDRPAPHPQLHAELTRLLHHSIRLMPLAKDGVAKVLKQEGRHPISDELVQNYHSLTNGNPLLLRALIDDQIDTTEESSAIAQEQPVVGVNYTHAAVQMIHRWDSQLREVAEAVAVLGPQASAGTIARLLDIREEAADELLKTLIDSGVLLADRFRHPLDSGVLTAERFRHPLAEAAVLDSMSACELSGAHGQAADILYRLGAPACDIADHLLAAGVSADQWMVTVLRDAAEEAQRRGAITAAARYLELALAACNDESARVEIMRTLVSALWRVNPSAAVPYLEPLKAAIHKSALSRTDASEVVRYLMWAGLREAASSAAAFVLDAADPVEPQVLAELSVAYHWFFGSAQCRFLGAAARNGQHRDLWADAAMRLTTLWTRGANDSAIANAEHILRSCRIEDTTIEVVATSLLVMACAGRTGFAETSCLRLAKEAARRGDVTWQAVLDGVIAQIALRHGDPARAVEYAESALALLPIRGWGVVAGLPLAALLSAQTARGNLKAAGEILHQGVPTVGVDTLFGLEFQRARGQYFLATDQVLAAGRTFQECSRLARQWDADIPALLPWRSDLAEVYLRLGRTVEARELAKLQLERCKRGDARTRGMTYRVLAAASELGERPALLQKAIDNLSTAGDRLGLSKALADFSVVHQEFGEFDRAREFARLAALAWTPDHTRRQADDRSSPIDEVPRPVERLRFGEPGPAANTATDGEAAAYAALSGAEQRVAQLAALGHTNREISRALHITVSTVEQHLTRVYKKLGISRRSDLARRSPQRLENTQILA